MPEFYDKLEEAAAICRSLAAKVDDRAEAQAMREIVEAIEEIIKLAKTKGSFSMSNEPPLTPGGERRVSHYTIRANSSAGPIHLLSPRRARDAVRRADELSQQGFHDIKLVDLDSGFEAPLDRFRREHDNDDA